MVTEDACTLAGTSHTNTSELLVPGLTWAATVELPPRYCSCALVSTMGSVSLSYVLPLADLIVASNGMGCGAWLTFCSRTMATQNWPCAGLLVPLGSDTPPIGGAVTS